MSIQNAVPQELYEYMCADYENALANIERIKSGIKDAKALGDLSENATYDNLMVEKSTCERQVRINHEFLMSCEVLSAKELVEKYPMLFAKVKVVITDLFKEISEECIIIPTSNIDVRIKNAVRVVDSIGMAIINMEAGEKHILLKRDNVLIEILDIEQYSDGSLEYKDE